MTSHFPVVDSEEIDEQGRRDETVMLALRTVEGLDINKFNQEFKADFLKDYSAAIKKNTQYLQVTPERLRIKDEYIFVQNSIICDFLS